MGGKRDTPAMRQYASFKQKHPDCLLFFRMGDFYEMFDDDAVAAHKALGITLTQRTEGVPMAGVPYHSAETYLRRLIEQGYRVAVCDQVQDPKEAKGIVERAVTRVLTPGTLVDDSLLRDDAPCTLACVCFLDPGEEPDARVGVASVELSTGAFRVGSCSAAELLDELTRVGASELLYCETANGEVPPRISRVVRALDIPPTPRPAWHFRHAEALEALLEQYAVQSLAGFGLSDDHPSVGAAGAIVRYLRETQATDDTGVATSEGYSSGTDAARVARARSLAHLQAPREDRPDDHLVIDAVSLRALEVERTIRSGALEGSLLGVFSLGGDGPRTPMGKRLLREWLCRPLRDPDRIRARQECVATFAEDRRTCDAFDERARSVQDVARISARVGLGRATPRDIAGLGRSLSQIDGVIEALAGAPAFDRQRSALESLRERLAPVAARITQRCVDDPPAHLREGGLFRDGIDEQLDEARSLQRESNTWLAEYQNRLIEEHDLPSLKVGFNKVFGYYIELPAAQARRAPDRFTRKQTLKNAERYITSELKEFEDKVLTAGERAVLREQQMFADLCAEVARLAPDVGRFAETIAELDVLAVFARRAVRRAWVRPELSGDVTLDIAQGRHPVLEEVLADNFVPNDARLGVADPEEEEDARARLALITGPNMAGKSTYIRQVALLCLLAHTGSFVPAERAVIGTIDRIFTRIGADDALHEGQSTFMVEMVETSNIIHNATERSLIVLDEVGRGTSTLDGLSLAWAIAERLAGSEDSPGPRCLFATHYHELTDLPERLPGLVRNLHVVVREWGDEVIFLHRIMPGRTNQSYGIHVARLAGLPPDIVSRANAILSSLSVSHGSVAEKADAAPSPPQASSQMALFTEYLNHPVVDELREVKLESLTPLQAFDLLRRMKERAGEEPAQS